MKHIPRKRFGQHFLIDRGIIDALVRAIDPRPEDVLVEIGPGLGALTEPLMAAKRAAPAIEDRSEARKPLHAVEFDRDLVARLKNHFPPGDLVVHEADALEFDFAQLLDPGADALRVAGNLPYNISSPLLFHLLNVADRVRDQHFMLQKEVVERMVAEPGGPNYGRLTVMLQVRYAMEMLFEVPPEAFDPPPRVRSAVVRMTPRTGRADRNNESASRPVLANQAVFAKLVALAFSQRRKMLRNTLKDYAAQMEAVGIRPTARAEEISVGDYVRFANRVVEDGFSSLLRVENILGS